MRVSNVEWRKILVVAASVALCATAGVAQRRNAAAEQDQFQFRFVGPIVGNRVASVAGVAGDESTYYA
ncbi:MAG: hypothetical protein WBE21_02180, partial [Candidatus Acidiferrales bacterium]